MILVEIIAGIMMISLLMFLLLLLLEVHTHDKDRIWEGWFK